MPRLVKTYLATVITLGSLISLATLAQWRCTDAWRFAVYLLFALIAGTLKVRLPRITGTYSLAFLFVLIGTSELSLGETIAIACSSIIVQSVWRPAQPAKFVQIVFNTATMAISVTLAFFAAQPVAALGFGNNVLVRLTQLALASGAYFLANTLLVSGILALTEQKPFKNVWSNWFRWSLRYYLVGVAIVALVLVTNRYLGWSYSLLVMPVMYLEYVYYRLYIREQQDSLSGTS